MENQNKTKFMKFQKTNNRNNSRASNNSNNAWSKQPFKSNGQKNTRTQQQMNNKKRNKTQSNIIASPPREHYPEGAIPQIVSPNIAEVEVVSDISKEAIENVLTAMYDETNKQTVSFDEALELIRNRETLAEDEEIIYSGKGSFAIVAYERIKNKRTLVIRKKIDFEKHQENLPWRESLCYGLALAYEPNPESLDNLYTNQEIHNFPLNKK